MMGQPIEQAKRFTLWEYTALRHNWNLRHAVEDPNGDPVEPPSEDFVRARQAELVELGLTGTKH